MTKIDIFSGFLGAGKTTLIKKLIKEGYKNEQLVLIENEFGEIGIDGGFLKEAGIQINEMNSGCICCSLVGDFRTALSKVLDEYHPDRIIIEPSGVGKLSDVINAVKTVANDEVQLNSFVTVADASKCKVYMKNFGEFFLDQVKSASTVIFSRTQLLDAGRVEKSRLLIAEAHPDARIITTPWDDMEPDFMLDVIENGKPMYFAPLEDDDDDDDDDDEHEHHHEHGEHEHHHEHHHHDDDDDDDDDDGHEHEHHHEHGEHEHHHHHEHDGHEHHHHHHHGEGEHDADEVFGNIGLETAQRYEQDEIRSILAKLSDEEEYGRILRAKGILQNAAGEWFQFDYVPGEIDLRDGSADYTGRLCVIGADLNEKALTELFHL